MRQMTLLTVFSLLISGCASIERPDANLCVVNAPAQHLKCYNLKTDYDQNGQILKGAEAKFFRAETVDDLNKGVWMSNADWSKVKVWISRLRKAYEKERGDK